MYRLLIADDEEEIRKGLALYFPWEEIGFIVAATAENGAEALEQVRRGDVDVVFTDIRMPVMSGIDLARTIFQEKLRVPVVFLSAYKDFAYAKRAMDYGVKSYVLKPTNYAEITDVFRKLKSELDYRLDRPASKAAENEEAGATKSDAIIARIRNYIDREYPRATLGKAAAIVQKNPQYVCRLFKQVTGTNFREYLTRIRMQKAARLLCDVNYLTYEVSEIVGYSDPKNFTRSFRKHYGVSPREYKRSGSQ